MLAGAAFPAAFLTLGGFVLLLLVTLSVPIIKSISLLVVDFTDGGVRAATIGVFGACYEGIHPNLPTERLGIEFFGKPFCTKASVGYSLDAELFGKAGNRAVTVVMKGLAGSLIINAIAAGFAGMSAIFALLAYFCSSRVMEVLTFVMLLLAASLAWLVWFLDLALVLVAKNRIKDATNGALTGHIGNAVWMGLAAAIALTIAICAAGCGAFGRYSSRNEYRNNATATTKPARRWPWQRKYAGAGTY